MDENGNITILGHNYNGGFFWNLNKLETNDEIKIVSNGIEYKYNIFKIYETNNDDLEVLKPIYEDSNIRRRDTQLSLASLHAGEY